MKTVLSMAVLLSISSSMLVGQTVVHPWHVVDNGGGKSTSAGITLHASIGQPVVQAMSATPLLLESGFVPGLRFLSGASLTLNTEVDPGWSMVSVPLVVANYNKTALYPTAISSAYRFNNGYIADDTLENGTGYWIKFPGAATVTFAGTAITRDTIDAIAGWNMIGMVSYPVLEADVTPVPPTGILTSFYGFSGTYFAEDTLKVGKAYWVKVSQAGQLVFTTGSVLAGPIAKVSRHRLIRAKPKKLEDEESVSHLTIVDALGRTGEVFFSAIRKDLDGAAYELPPAPPEGVLDVRFRSQRRLETEAGEFPLLISSALYPITLSWQIAESKGTYVLELGSPAGQLQTHRLDGTGSVMMNHLPAGGVKIKVTEPDAVEIPSVFALRQNYPNPFNPVTVIRYDVPVQSHVSLKIYDVLGREVVTLVDGVQEVGYHRVEWGKTLSNSVESASGVYFYRIEAVATTGRGIFSAVRKMILLK